MAPMLLPMLKTANLQEWGTNIQQLIDKIALPENLSTEYRFGKSSSIIDAASQGGSQFRLTDQVKEDYKGKQNVQTSTRLGKKEVP